MTLVELRQAMETDPRLRPLSQAQRTDLALAYGDLDVTTVIAWAVRTGRLVRARTNDDEVVYAVPTGPRR